MNNETKRALSRVFSQLWLKRKNKTIELDAEACLLILGKIRLAHLTIFFSILYASFFTLVGVLGDFQGYEYDGTIIAGAILSLIVSYVSNVRKTRLNRSIGEAGIKLARDWSSFLKDLKRLNITISTCEPESMDVGRIRMYAIDILEKRAKEVYNLEQLELESERLRLRPTMEQIIALFKTHFEIVNLGKVGSYFPAGSESRRAEEEKEKNVKIRISLRPIVEGGMTQH